MRLNRIPEDIPTIPVVMQELGYRTFGVSDNINISKELGFAQGFDRFLHGSILAEGEKMRSHDPPGGLFLVVQEPLDVTQFLFPQQPQNLFGQFLGHRGNQVGSIVGRDEVKDGGDFFGIQASEKIDGRRGGVYLPENRPGKLLVPFPEDPEQGGSFLIRELPEKGGRVGGAKLAE